MGYSCRCGAVYADSDVAEFMQHVQKCSGVRKSGEGERAQPTSRGDEREASGSQNLNISRDSLIERAEQKKYSFSRSRVNRERFKNMNEDGTFDGEDDDDEWVDESKGASSSRERAQPTPRGDEREASGSQNLNISRDSLIERAEQKKYSFSRSRVNRERFKNMNEDGTFDGEDDDDEWVDESKGAKGSETFSDEDSD